MCLWACQWASCRPYQAGIRARAAQRRTLSRIRTIINPHAHPDHAEVDADGHDVQREAQRALRPQQPLDGARRAAVEAVDRVPHRAAERPPRQLPAVDGPGEQQHEAPGDDD